MSKHTPSFEWQVAPDDAEWPIVAIPTPLGAPATTALDATAHWYTRRWLWGGVLTLLLLASAGGWVWRKAQAGLGQIEAELSSAVQLELETVAQGLDPLAASRATSPMALAWKLQLERELGTLQTALPSGILGSQLTTDLRMINLQDELASAYFVTTAKDGTQAYRQTRFYRQTAEGWQRTEPNAELWGPPRRLESSHFIFNFRQNYAQIVTAVAPQMDALYTELQRNFGLAPSTEKLVIEVTVERVTAAISTPQGLREPLVVPSPAVYLAPVDLSDAAILAQSIALPLLKYMSEQAVKAHTIPVRWQPLLDGLHLWQLWDLDMPLARWRHDVVAWLYIDLPTTDLEPQSVLLSDTYLELCAMHSLWMISPTLVRIPFECTAQEPVTWSPRRWLAYLPFTRLDQLMMPRTGHHQLYDEENYFYRSSEAVRVATLVEYAVAAYGYEQLPVLLADLAQYDTWDMLLPAVYGISSAEFVEGWQEYLVKEYGVQP